MSNSETSTPALRVDGLVKLRAEKRVLDRISFSLPQGHVLSLWGPNGAGKSTLLRILAGILDAEEGAITGTTSQKRSYMPDRLDIAPSVRLRDWIGLYAKVAGVGVKKVQGLVSELGLSNLDNQTISTFSRGMIQRLLFVRMLLNDPALILMDEPENGLDPHWVQEWKERVKGFRNAGKTVIFSTHLLSDALDVADQVIVLSNGRILSDKASAVWKQDQDPAKAYLSLIDEGGSGV